MSWYRAGTAQVTTGSAAVGGAGTFWVSQVKIGEAFSGPDGLLYEISNIASDTSLTLSTPYGGINAVGVPYVIVPTQSILKTLASQVGDLIVLYQAVPADVAVASTAASSATLSATLSGTRAAAALVSQNAAATSVTGAAASATNASASATGAAASASTATTQAAAASSSTAAALTSQNAAGTSATGASTSASTATTQAAAASASAAAALVSRNAGATSATSASTSATGATASAATATTKATEASSSAAAALVSQNATATSAASASAAAGTAATSATGASNSATSATGSASTATTQAGNAGTSATNAATSATNAATSATNATATGLSTVLSGLSFVSSALITASDTIIAAFGRLQAQISTNLTAFTSHSGNVTNPHSTTKAHVGLGNADNTSDINKPISSVALIATGMRNRIINGDMRIDQRNSGAALTVTTGQFFAVDRFFSENQTGTGNIVAQQSLLGQARSLRLTAVAGITNLTADKYLYGVNHVIEAQNVADLNGRPITISFKVETNGSGNLPVALRNAASSRSYVVNTPLVAGVNNVVIVVPLEATTVATNGNAPGLALTIGFNNEGIYRTATTGAWIPGNFLVSTLSTQWAKDTNAFLNITDLQLEAGSVATPFERRPIGLELALCQRYFQKGYTPNQYLGVYWANTNTFYGQTLTYPVSLRVNPSLLAVAANPTTGNYWTDPGTSFYSADTKLGVGASGSENAFRIQQSRTAGGTTPVSGYSYFFEAGFIYTASAEL